MINFLKSVYRRTYKTVFSKYDVIIENELKDLHTLLDVGCGNNSPVKSFATKMFKVGVDAFLPSIEESKKQKIHNEYYCLDILKIDQQFKSNEFDAVVACDVIEHLKKEDGLKLLDMMEKIAAKKVIIYTPNGFLKQGDRFNNPWQVHLSGWEVEEFKNRGYHVIGINGIKSLRGEYAKVKYKPAFVWNFISDLTELFVHRKPDSAFQLLAIKNKN